MSGVVLRVLADEPHGVVADGVGVVVRLRLVLRVGVRRDHRVVADERGRVVEAAGPVDRAVVAVEAALSGQLCFGPSGSMCRVTCHLPTA